MPKKNLFIFRFFKIFFKKKLSDGYKPLKYSKYVLKLKILKIQLLLAGFLPINSLFLFNYDLKNQLTLAPHYSLKM